MHSRTLLRTIALFVLAAPGAVDFETPLPEPASASLGPQFVSGANFKVAEPVESDGLMHHYVIESSFGQYPAYGQVALHARLTEVAALTELSKKTDAGVVAKTVEMHMQNDAKTVEQFVTNPIGTITGIPKGIEHLFSGYKAQAKELKDQTNMDANCPAAQHGGSGANAPSRTAASVTSNDSSSRATESGVSAQASTSASDTQAQHCRSSSAKTLVKNARSDATRYADRYLGISAAERRYYQQLGVDPYTTNSSLRKSVHHLAKVEAVTSLGLHFARLPGVPYLSDVRHAMDAVYNEDPAVLRERQRKVLAGYGLSSVEIAQFENTLLLSPTRQALLAEDAKALEGVAGRDEIFRHAMSLTTEEEVEVFLESMRLLTRLHTTHPLARILAGLLIPGAETQDGHLAVAGAFDAIYWTADVAGYEAALRAALPPSARGPEIWLSGSISERARRELVTRGWEVHDHAWDALGESPTKRAQAN